MKDIEDGMKDDVKYSLQALEGMLIMEKDRNVQLRKDFDMLRARKQVINKFEEGDFKY